MIRTYRFADRNVGIASLFAEIHELCALYRTDGRPDFTVQTTPADIRYEHEKSARKEALQGLPPRSFSDAYLETLAVYRKIAERMPAFDTFLFHGSAIAVDGCAYVFTAKSGTGKSTHAALWRKMLGKDAVMVNDDKPLIRVTEREAIVYGTPWDGKHRLSSNISVPLKAICILSRADENRMEQVSYEDALPMLMQQAYRPADPAALMKTLQLIDGLNVSFYRLSCNMDISAAELSYRSMKEA